jgi:diguanylate cyclase (GGDEF)-like protein
VFPAVTMLVLGILWWPTLNLIKVERLAAEQAASVSSGELAETYEAQVVRALREIDQTLKVVKYAYERDGSLGSLHELNARALLPPDLLFVVSLVDLSGYVTVTNRPSEIVSVYDEDVFQSQLWSDTLVAGRPRKGLNGEWILHFSRRLNAADGSFAGVVLIAVDTAYFVSGYDASKLGGQGVLGILGADGVFRARRSGDVVSAGDLADYAAAVPESAEEGRAIAVSESAWDGVRRYSSARRLYDFPLAVIVGLSEDEQMAGARQSRQTYLWRAGAGSLLLILVAAALGWLGRQLALARQRVVEEQIAHALRVEHLAYHDGLTGLPNRSLFSKLLTQSILGARRQERQLAVLFLDLDRFKQINDTLGHEAGDQLLQEVATRLKACLRDSDTVARMGGDEFVILLPEPQEEKYVATVAQKALTAVCRPYVLLGQEFRVTASIGISVYPQDGLDEQTLTKNADIAMYQAKEMGKNNFQFYSEKLNANSLERLSLESGLRHALERGEFEVQYQPKRDISSGRITGVEAQLRWQHPDLGIIVPMQFMAVAEDTGLILPIGKWVLRTVCLQHAAWRQQGLPPLTMAVNLSAPQFADEHLLPDLADILAHTGMDPRLLELEIAESLLMRDVRKSLATLARLKDIGIRIAIADFGVGYSSLSTLRQFPLDTIKIDRSFIRDVTSEAEDKTLTRAVIAMGRTLSMAVVAQGVETKEQADFLLQNSCDELQGFYFNASLSASQVAELVGKQSVGKQSAPATGPVSEPSRAPP